MSALSLPTCGLGAPLWFSIAALGGLAWNLFGAVQFAGWLMRRLQCVSWPALSSC